MYKSATILTRTANSVRPLACRFLRSYSSAEATAEVDASEVEKKEQETLRKAQWQQRENDVQLFSEFLNLQFPHWSTERVDNAVLEYAADLTLKKYPLLLEGMEIDELDEWDIYVIRRIRHWMIENDLTTEEAAEIDWSRGYPTLEYAIPQPAPHHTYEELPIIKEVVEWE